MVSILIGIIFVLIAAYFDKIAKKLNVFYLFENKKYYYLISFSLNFIGYSFIFGSYGIVISILILVAMVTFEMYIKK